MGNESCLCSFTYLETIMDALTQIVADINSILWGPWCLIPVLVGAGIFFTFKLRFVQIRQFGRAVKHVFGGLSFNGEKAGNHGMTSFQSLATAIAAQVGTGNLEIGRAHV